MVVLFLIFKKLPLFSIAAAAFYVLTSSAQGFQFLHILTSPYFLVLFGLVRFLLFL